MVIFEVDCDCGEIYIIQETFNLQLSRIVNYCKFVISNRVNELRSGDLRVNVYKSKS